MVSVSVHRKRFWVTFFGFGILVALASHMGPRGIICTYFGFDASCRSVEEVWASGLVQLAVPLLPAGGISWGPWILWLALGNILVVGAITVAQNNLKSMIGNGSVMHMGYCFLGLGVCSSLGASATIMLMCAHGLSVSLMFLVANCVSQRTNTLEMDAMGGLAAKTPLLACFFAAATFATIGLPGFGNFWGEFAIFLSGEYAENHLILGMAALGIIISQSLDYGQWLESSSVINQMNCLLTRRKTKFPIFLLQRLCPPR